MTIALLVSEDDILTNCFYFTDMLFEEDTTLLSFFDRYAEEDDYEAL